MTYLLLATGLLLLVLGGDILVRGAVRLAARLGVSPLLVGLTVVGFGTSTPELVTSLDAAFSGLPGIAVGNIVGSNIANILLILGLTALIAPVAVARGAFRRDGAALALATLAGMAAVLTGWLSRPAGIALILGLAGYITLAYIHERRATKASTDAMDAVDAMDTDIPTGEGRIGQALFLTLAGIAVTVLGARLLVSSAVELAGNWGVSDTLIGLTVVAVGTSLPELVTSLMAAARRQSDLALGNVVGSNIYNILGILGTTATIHPIPVPEEIAELDVWVMLAATLALIVLALAKGRIGRLGGALMLTGYFGYTGWIVAVG